MRKTLLFTFAFLFAGCRSGGTGSESDSQAVKRYQSNGEFIIAAQKPDDMTIVDVGNRQVSFRTADGKNGTVSLVNNSDYYFISVREALADGVGAYITGQAMRDVFLIPKVNGRRDPTVSSAKSENWRIDKIVSIADNHAEIKGVRIYCPIRIEFRRKDGSPAVVQFEPRSNCASDIGTFIGGVTYK